MWPRSRHDRHGPGELDRLRRSRRQPPARGPGCSSCCRRRPTRPTTSGAASRSTSTRTAARDTVSGTGRAVKVSFNRPAAIRTRQPRPATSGPTSTWSSGSSEQGYDVTYTDDVAVASGPDRAAPARGASSSPATRSTGRCEEFNGVKAARDAGVNIASFSANTAYWKVRYENGTRTLVCYKTVQGDGSAVSGRDQRQRLGPDGLENTADDALGLDGARGHGRRPPRELHHHLPRQRRAPTATPTRRPAAASGRTCPRTSSSASCTSATTTAHNYPLTSPGGQRRRRVRRPTASGAAPASRPTPRRPSASDIVGWEWDAVPTQAQYPRASPPGSSG